MAAQPYGLANMATIYQATLHDLYTDQIGHIHPLSEPDLSNTDQFSPAINMVQIHSAKVLYSPSWKKISG